MADLSCWRDFSSLVQGGARTVFHWAKGALVEAPYSVEGNSFHAGKPQLLFQGGFELRNPYIPYGVAPDGKHFAMLVAVQGKTTEAALPTVVVNWFARVQSLVAAGQR